MSKSKFISGKEIVDEEGIQGFEFVNDFVKKGLKPHGKKGQLLSPEDVIRKTSNIEYTESLLLRRTDDDPEETLIIQSENESAKAMISDVEGKGWDEYDLPDNEEDALPIVDELCNALYLRKEIKGQPKLIPADSEDIYQKPIRPSSKHAEQCIKIAKQFWGIDQTIHPKYIAETDEIAAVAVKKNGEGYYKKTVMDWIRPHWPEKYPGTPRKPKNWPFPLNVQEL